MLGHLDATANLAVKDQTTARQFYEGVLGLESAHAQGEELVTYRSGQTLLNVYRS